jgi:hypothetical protein
MNEEKLIRIMQASEVLSSNKYSLMILEQTHH